MLAQDHKFKKPYNILVRQLECHCYPFLLLFYSNKIEFEFERDKLFQLLLGIRLFSISNFDHLLEKEFIIYSRTDILTGISKYRINVEKVNHFSNMLKSEDLATYAVIEGEIASEVNISKARHVSVVSKNINQTSLFENLEGITELRTFLLIGDYGSSLNQIPSTFFTAHQAMETLDLSGSHISELPSSVGEMKLLRFLDLSYTLIQRLPESIHHLTKLQTLRLKECKLLHSLPNRMKELTSLCYLDFDVLGQLTCMPQGMGALTELRTLSAFIVSREDGCSLRELKNLNNLSGSLCISGLEYATRKDAQEAMMENKRYIDRLHLKWNESTTYDAQATEEAEFVLYGLEMKTPLKELQISFYPGSVLPKSILVNNLEQLVSITFYRWDIESLFALDRLSNLKEITFIDMDRVKSISSNLYRRFQKIRYPKLETFTIDGMLELENWTGIEECDCPFLSKLSVNYCPKLTQLDFLPHLQSLEYLEISHCESLACLPNGPLPASLQTLVVYKCNNLKTRCSNGGEDWDKIKHVPNIWIDMKGGIVSTNKESDSDEYSDYCSDYDSKNENDDTLI